MQTLANKEACSMCFKQLCELSKGSQKISNLCSPPVPIIISLFCLMCYSLSLFTNPWHIVRSRNVSIFSLSGSVSSETGRQLKFHFRLCLTETQSIRVLFSPIYILFLPKGLFSQFCFLLSCILHFQVKFTLSWLFAPLSQLPSSSPPNLCVCVSGEGAGWREMRYFGK